jgi:hypothetical protein
MRKKTVRTKAKPPQRDQAWFERKVAELKAALEKLPAERREQLERELEKLARESRPQSRKLVPPGPPS